MICPVCKNEIADGSAFCGYCAAQLSAPQTAAPQPFEQQPQPQQYQGYGTPDYLSGQAPSYGTPERNEAPVQPQPQYDPAQQQAPEQYGQAVENEYQQSGSPENAGQPFDPIPDAPQQQYPGYNTPVNLSNQQPSYGAPRRAENGSNSLALGIVVIAVIAVLIVVGIVLAIKGGKNIKEAIESKLASEKAYISVSIDNTV